MRVAIVFGRLRPSLNQRAHLCGAEPGLGVMTFLQSCFSFIAGPTTRKIVLNRPQKMFDLCAFPDQFLVCPLNVITDPGVNGKILNNRIVSA